MDWDKPVSQEELNEIEAAFDQASSLFQKRKTTNHINTSAKISRRLPDWESHDRQFQPRVLRSEVRSKLNGEIENNSKSCSESNYSPRNESWGSRLRPHRVKVTVNPAIKFGGQIVYCRTVPEVEKATVELMGLIEAKQKNMEQVTLGLDIEWRPTFRRGEVPRKAAVMQICGDTSRCYVLHIIHSGIPPTLQSLLEDPTILKVGVCIAGDADKVSKDYNVHIKSLEDLSWLANQKLDGFPRRWSLAALTEMLTGKELEKPNKIRLGNWEVEILSEGQLQYAATDAFVSWHLYEILKSFPDRPQNQVGEQMVALQS
ncbi:Werner syndrome-like exonuclease [Thalictrum thalictroides]|uniref:3'-5' exonuclease n=1 Tax=Thalictrum thalictroides TaxID=46969 RepID=A0A7J6WQV9_THATH|nr:Werner syndrome-like exonuclease [Thalictrum thalictroides]